MEIQTAEDGPEIRLFRDADLHPLNEMICKTIEYAYSLVYPARAVSFFKDYHSENKILERSRAGEIFVIEKNGRIVATGALVGQEITGVFVRPDHHGLGLGTALMSALESRARENGFSEVTLNVSLPSKEFYEGLNYDILESCQLDVGNGQHLNYWQGRKTTT